MQDSRWLQWPSFVAPIRKIYIVYIYVDVDLHGVTCLRIPNLPAVAVNVHNT